MSSLSAIRWRSNIAFISFSPCKRCDDCCPGTNEHASSDTASTDTGTCVDDGAVSIFSASEYGAQWIIFEGGKMGTRLFLSAIVAVVFGLTGANPSSAQSIPDRLIKIVVPYPPGGPADVAARSSTAQSTKGWALPKCG